MSLQWSAAQSLLADEISIDLQIFCSLADPRPHNCLSSHTTYIIQYTSYVHTIYMSGVWSGVLYVMLHNGTWRLSGLSMSTTMRIYNINSCKKSSAKKSWFCSASCPNQESSPVCAPLSVCIPALSGVYLTRSPNQPLLLVIIISPYEL